MAFYLHPRFPIFIFAEEHTIRFFRRGCCSIEIRSIVLCRKFATSHGNWALCTSTITVIILAIFDRSAPLNSLPNFINRKNFSELPFMCDAQPVPFIFKPDKLSPNSVIYSYKWQCQIESSSGWLFQPENHNGATAAIQHEDHHWCWKFDTSHYCGHLSFSRTSSATQSVWLQKKVDVKKRWSFSLERKKICKNSNRAKTVKMETENRIKSE